MAKRKIIQAAVTKPFSVILSLTVWLTGILVSLAVGFGMADGVLRVRWLPEVLTQIAGWIVVFLTIISIILAILDRM